jgi:hypothetical protein
VTTPEAVAAVVFPGAAPAQFAFRRAVSELANLVNLVGESDRLLATALVSFWEVSELPGSDTEYAIEGLLWALERTLTAGSAECRAAREDVASARGERTLAELDYLSRMRRAGQ